MTFKGPKIVKMRLSDMAPAPYNPRITLKPGMPQFEKLRKSIKKFDLVELIVVNKRSGHIVSGHQRYYVLKYMAENEGTDPDPEIDVVEVDLSDGREKALNVAMNKVQGEWDNDLLMDLLVSLGPEDFQLTGFDDFELSGIEEALRGPTDVKEDDFEPEVPDEPKTQPGDIYRLGDHVLMCGSSTDESDMARLREASVGEGFIDLMVTDPPYGVNYEEKSDSLVKYRNGTMKTGAISGDNLSGEGLEKFLTDFMRNAMDMMKDGGAFYIWHASINTPQFAASVTNTGGKIHLYLLWVKQHFVMSRWDYHPKHEPCLYGWKTGARHYFIDDRTKTTVLEYDRPIRSELHPTMKPIPLIAELVNNSSRPNEWVLDAFGGSGTTLIACEQLGRKCAMMELDPGYCDVIVKRWEEFTGREAELM